MKINKQKKSAFLLGNLAPDVNPFSYIDYANKKYLSGHTYHCRKKFMQNLWLNSCNNTITGWYHAGELLHYLADSFTRPHNEEFHYSLKAHVKYESKLHQSFQMQLKSKMIEHTMNNSRMMYEFSQWLDKKHEEYLEKAKDIQDDCQYIIHASTEVCRGLLERLRHKKVQIVGIPSITLKHSLKINNY